MNIQNRYSDNLIGYTSGGARLDPVRVGATDNSTLGHTLGVGTFYFPLDVLDDAAIHVTMKWSAALAATITLETTDFPVAQSNQIADVTEFSATAGDWSPEPLPANAYALPNGVGNTAAGNATTALSIVAGGTNAGGASFNSSAICARRARLKVVTTVGGLFRAANNAIREST